MKKVGISVAEVYERVGKSVILSFHYVLRPKRDNVCILRLRESQANTLVWDLFIF